MKRVFVTGDLHQNTEQLYTLSHRHKLTEEDYLIVAGDFGFIWNKDYPKMLERMHQCTPAHILFVKGNHENHYLLENEFKYVDMFGDVVRKIDDKCHQLLDGHFYDILGHKIFTFGGARSTDKQYRTEGRSWWAQEEPTYEEINNGLKTLMEHTNEIEYVITHECPDYIYRKIDRYYNYGSSVRFNYLLSSFLDRVYIDLRYSEGNFKMWFGGHHHIDEVFESEKYAFMYRGVIEIK